MARESFVRELQELQDQLLVLGSKAEAAVMESVEILKRQDLEAARQLVARDEEINRLRFAVESKTLTLIATQQPLAGDLRVLAAILEIATELERIADYGKGIARITLLIGHKPFIKPIIDLPRMAEKAMDMLRRALDAFVKRDADTAREIPKEDGEIDALYNQIYRELLTFILGDPRTLDQATYLLWVGHNLERAGDRVTNVCERIVFMVTGEMTEMDGESGETIGVESLG